MQQAIYSDKDPINMLSFQNISQHISIASIDLNTNTHTHTHTHTHTTCLTNFIFQRQVKTV